MNTSAFDLFGNKIETKPLLRDKFIEPPFSILNAASGSWQKRKRLWKKIGIQSELGRTAKTFNMEGCDFAANQSDVSIFDPALCEVLYKWFCPDAGLILDPFAGGSVRGIVAAYLGYKYLGIDIRSEQVKHNEIQAQAILDNHDDASWITGDSKEVLSEIEQVFDFVFSCPPYHNLEVYSDLNGDISNMSYNDFLSSYKSIINQSCSKLKKGGFACFVVGEIRDKKGNYVGFVPDTIRAFQDAGMHFYNECIYAQALNTAAARANGNMKNKKLVKVHQNVLIFRK